MNAFDCCSYTHLIAIPIHALSYTDVPPEVREQLAENDAELLLCIGTGARGAVLRVGR